MASEPRTKRRPPKFVRVIRARPRLFLSALFGLLVIAALPNHWPLTTRLLVGWDVGVALYLIVAYELMMRTDLTGLRQRAALQDEGRIAVLVLTVIAALASMAAIVIELATPTGGAREPIKLGLAVVTIVLSWAFVHTIFALHYAHEYHDEKRQHRPGLAFPGDEEPDYWDFVYFSFVIGMTSQVSDVAITCKPIRQTALAHGIVSFMFNATLLALTVNIAASAI
jgi:uncharacterized membrane protein